MFCHCTDYEHLKKEQKIPIPMEFKSELNNKLIIIYCFSTQRYSITDYD